VDEDADGNGVEPDVEYGDWLSGVGAGLGFESPNCVANGESPGTGPFT